MSQIPLQIVDELTPGVWVIFDGDRNVCRLVEETIKVDGHLFATKLMGPITTTLPPNVVLAEMPKHYGAEVLVHDLYELDELGTAVLRKRRLCGQSEKTMFVDAGKSVSKAYFATHEAVE